MAKRSRRPSMEMKINNNSCLFLLLPIEIVVEIFSRLPVDSVSQCKLVCKTWLDVINHHFNKYSNVMIGGTFLLRLPYSGPASGFHYGEYYNDDKQIPCFNLTKKPIFNHDQHPFENAKKWYVVGSCNGLICLRQRWYDNYLASSGAPDDMYVCNPYTGEYAKLPNPNYPRVLLPGHSLLAVGIACGFGYHPITKEYKVIRICYQENNKRMSISRGHVEVYTLGSDTTAWRSIGEIEDTIYKTIENAIHGSGNNSCGILLNGALYWLTEKRRIVSFDLADEEFRDISSPRLELYNHVIALGVLSGCLCVINNVNHTTHIWVMNNKDYSWSNKFNIPWNEEHYWCNNYLLAHLESGKILLRYNYSTFATYDPETEHIVELKMNDKLFDIIPYTKSSVSLKALGEKEAIQVTA